MYIPHSYKNENIAEVKDLDCRPCSKIGYNACPKGHFKCMNEQDIDAIIARANEAFPSV